MYYVYAIKSLIKRYIYVGMTSNLEHRIQQHRDGKEKTTAPYRPFEHIHTEQYQTRLQARKREKYLKSGSGKEWLKKSIHNN